MGLTTHADELRALHATGLFTEVEERLLIELAELASFVDVAAGDPVVRQGEPSAAMYVIEEGVFEVSVEVGHGRQIVAEIGRGELIGEVQLLTGGARTATVHARTPGRRHPAPGADVRGDASAGVDDDIDTGGLLRLHPDQPWRSYHRLQALYFPLLYSLSALGWYFADFVQYRTMRVGTARIPDFTPGEHALFWGGKALWIGLVFVVPMMFHPPWLVITTALAVYLVLGFNIALIFQLAHVVDDATWVRPASDGTIDHEWAVHQLMTTVNFGTANGLWNWYTGGLSYQVEHHLFPRISHVHYPAISRVVKQTCAELGLPYHEHRHTRSVVAAHLRHLAAMGRRPPQADRSSSPAHCRV